MTCFQQPHEAPPLGRERYAALRHRFKHSLLEASKALLAIRDEQLYLLEYEDWESFCRGSQRVPGSPCPSCDREHPRDTVEPAADDAHLAAWFAYCSGLGEPTS